MRGKGTTGKKRQQNIRQGKDDEEVEWEGEKRPASVIIPKRKATLPAVAKSVVPPAMDVQRHPCPMTYANCQVVSQNLGFKR